MIDKLPWQFEECDTEGEIDLTRMQPFEHAVRGRREGGRSVMGYGHTPPLAEQDARQEAQCFDAREVLGIAPDTRRTATSLGTEVMYAYGTYRIGLR